jgi:uroporphyrin-III C-methyltransferase
VLPGISSALAAPLAAGIPVTHRGVADQVLIATGMLRDGTAGSIPSFTCGRTTVLLMAVKRLKTLPQELLQAGYPATCSITVIEQAHTIHQRVHRTSINDLHLLSKVQIASPAAVVIGNAGEVLQ